MLPKGLIKGFDKRRLRNFLALFFMALAVPTAILVWQTYSQLKWEAFHQHRGVAEELTRRIDARLNEMIRIADARSFADYTFLVVSGDPSANFVQRSPLSAWPVTEDLPGVLGYFQVDTAGVFSTPLLPPEGTQAASLGINAEEYANRLQLAQLIHTVLADNRLVRPRPDSGVRRGLDAPFAASEMAPDRQAETEEDQYGSTRDRQVTLEPERQPATGPAGTESDAVTPVVVGGLGSQPSASNVGDDGPEASPSEQITNRDEGYSQIVFDRLTRSRSDTRVYSDTDATPALDEAPGEAPQAEQRLNDMNKVSRIKLDAALQEKSERAERKDARERLRDDITTSGRIKRRETTALPEATQSADSELTSNAASVDLRISTFESEIDPLEFSLLDSGHFVVFRKVWRDGERYIQGLVVDQNTFTQDTIGKHFMETTLASMSNLILAYQDDVINTFSGRGRFSYPNVAEDLGGALLYRNRLTAPLNSLELIFSIQRLPPGPGGKILGWLTLVLAIVFLGGFVTLYRLGLGQINLARQQQDFVSAVSHELKTPLTSIRMYGEMLKEGWADEEKRQSYYEYIHDESERLSRLISNVLQLAKITRNEPQFDLRPTRVGELMSNIESKISSQVERAGFDLRFKRFDNADNAKITIDEDCFAQIVINLVDNAIKFSKNAEEKIIEVSSRRTADDRILFSVRDFGPGIPRDQMKKIFQLFYRSESELTRETVGTGIGLAIVHQLTLAMNGSVDMINVEPGAEFRIGFAVTR